jgi:uncharacterized protein YcfJ
MSKRAVFCIATSEAQAFRIIEAVKAAGFPPDDVSVLFPDHEAARDLAPEKRSKAPEGATAGSLMGGVLGGLAGWLMGMGRLAIPGLRPFIAAGPIMSALGGAAAGAAAGGLTGGLIGLGMPEPEAKRYAGRIRSGNILISVHTADRDELEQAKDIFQRAGGAEVSSAGESVA